MLAAFLFVGVVSAVGAAIFVSYRAGKEETAPASETAEEASASEPAPQTAAKTKRVAPSLEEIAWTTEAPSTLKDLARTWKIPRDALAELNPELPDDSTIEAGTRVVVYSHTHGASVSVGPPNDGRLIRGVPLPEGEAWLPPEDRSRAFATAETIAAVTAALESYGQRFPEAEPIQMGDLSARRGGEIYGHQSHQTGRDVDIRLILNAAGDSFDAERNWFLVKTLVDGGDVRQIFLNRTEQAWLRETAEADVGAALAEEYFGLIDHEPGHTIHMHVRFACPEEDKRCVGYSMPDTDEQDPKKLTKLPLRPGAKPTRGTTKLPGSRPKGARPTKKKRPRKKKKKLR